MNSLRIALHARLRWKSSIIPVKVMAGALLPAQSLAVLDLLLLLLVILWEAPLLASGDIVAVLSELLAERSVSGESTLHRLPCFHSRLYSSGQDGLVWRDEGCHMPSLACPCGTAHLQQQRIVDWVKMTRHLLQQRRMSLSREYTLIRGVLHRASSMLAPVSCTCQLSQRAASYRMVGCQSLEHPKMRMHHAAWHSGNVGLPSKDMNI